MWLCLRERLLTNGERVRRHLTTDGVCAWCKNGNEDALHVLSSCTSAHGLWSGLIPQHLMTEFEQGNLQQWLSYNLVAKHRFGYANWSLLFGIVCWLCWKRRNIFVFEGVIQEGRGASIIAKGMAEAFSLAGRAELSAGTKRVLVGWNLLPHGWVEVNSDGSVKNSDFKAAAGGVIMGVCGEWLGGYARNIGSCSIARAELWGVYDGLHLAWEKGFKNVIIEVDSLFVINAIQKVDCEGSSYHSLVRGIQNVLALEWRVSFQHVYLEGNRCADLMTALGASLPIGCHYFEQPTTAALAIINEEISGVSFPRLGLI